MCGCRPSTAAIWLGGRGPTGSRLGALASPDAAAAAFTSSRSVRRLDTLPIPSTAECLQGSNMGGGVRLDTLPMPGTAECLQGSSMGDGGGGAVAVAWVYYASRA